MFLGTFLIAPSRLRRLTGEGTWIVLGQVATVAGALVLVRTLTEYLDPAQYGQLVLGLSLASLVNQVVMGGITAAISRFHSVAVEREEVDAYLRGSHCLLGYATLAVIGLGLAIASGLLWSGYPQWLGLAAAALVLATINGYNSAISGLQNAARQRAVVAFHGGMDSWLRILMALVVMIGLGVSETAVLIGYICSSAVVTASQIFFLKHMKVPVAQANPPRAGQPWALLMWQYARPFATWGVFTWLQQVSDRWSLQAFASTAEVGQYAVLFQLGYTPVAMLSGLAISFLGPILYQRAGDATDTLRNADVARLGWRLTNLSLMTTLLCSALAYGTHEEIFSLLVATEFGAASYLLPWVVFAGGIFSAGQMLSMRLMSEMKSAAMSSAKISTALLGIILNICGAALGGVPGVVAALVTFSILFFLSMARLERRSCATTAQMEGSI